jgi:hypothetical protein
MKRHACFLTVARLYLLAGMGVLLVGCEEDLSFWEYGQVKYAAHTDRFRYLRVLVHVRSGADPEKKEANYDYGKERDGDYDYLAGIWENRHDIILAPEIMFFDDVFVKVARRDYRPLSLSKRSDEPNLQTSPIDLDEIVVRPGEFFATQRGTLAYYHVTEAPGAVVSELAQIVVSDLFDQSLEPIAMERMRRRNGGERLPWPDEEQLKQIFAGAGSDEDGAEPVETEDPYIKVLEENPLACFSDESLMQVDAQIAADGLIVTRQASTLSLAVPLSDDDTQGLLRVLAEINRQIQDDELFSDEETQVMSSFEIKQREDGVTLEVDLVKAFTPPTNWWEATRDVELRDEAMSAVTEMKSRGVPVSDDLSFAGVIEDFSRSGGRGVLGYACAASTATLVFVIVVVVFASQSLRQKVVGFFHGGTPAA